MRLSAGMAPADLIRREPAVGGGSLLKLCLKSAALEEWKRESIPRAIDDCSEATDMR